MVIKMQTEIVQRQYDKKWVVFGWMLDPNENPEDWQDREMLMPYRWVALKVFETQKEASDESEIWKDKK
jgi:hypothetical protein